MKIQLRLYKIHDIDLIALVDAGYDIRTMFKKALNAFAEGQALQFVVQTPLLFDQNKKDSVRVVFSVSTEKVVYMLNHLKHRYRNAFCKAVLRNALYQQNLVAFFADTTLLPLQTVNLNSIGRNIVEAPKIGRVVSFLGNTYSVPEQKISVPVSNQFTEKAQEEKRQKQTQKIQKDMGYEVNPFANMAVMYPSPLNINTNIPSQVANVHNTTTMYAQPVQQPVVAQTPPQTTQETYQQPAQTPTINKSEQNGQNTQNQTDQIDNNTNNTQNEERETMIIDGGGAGVTLASNADLLSVLENL